MRSIAQIRANLRPWIDRQRRGTRRVSARYRSSPEWSSRGGTRWSCSSTGQATFDSLLAGIAQAQALSLVQFYMFHDDGLGRRVQQALIERAHAGIRVYMLYDEVGSNGLPKAYLDKLRAAGVEVSSFKPTQGVGNRFQLNFRNHRKMVVVDGVTGWIGGHNVGDEYLGLDPEMYPLARHARAH